MQNPPLIWYASYGSNLLEKRFLCYIAGGTPAGAQRKYLGCADKAPPRLSKPVTINSELYFARRSKTWSGGGVAFIKPEFDPAAKTLGRMYLITAPQFAELVKQEIRMETELTIDLGQLIRKGSLIIDERSWYNKLLFLGTQDGYPILTFTNKNYLKDELNPPDPFYIKMITGGLKETYGMSDENVQEYLETKEGY